MSRVIFLNRRFCPGEAWTNRMLAYAKGFSEQGVRVCLLFIISDKCRTPYSINIPGVEIINLWENDGWLSRTFRALSYLKNKRRIKKFIHDGDICFMTDASGFYLDEVKASGKDVKNVYEATEHPLVLTHNNPQKTKKRFEGICEMDRLLVISHSLKHYFIQKGFPENRIEVINMFVDLSRFNGLKKESTYKYIAYCGNVSYDKDGVNILIESFAEFHKLHPDYYLEIYGRGVGNSIEKLSILAEERGVAEFVVFTGMISYDIIPQKLVNAAVLALSRPDNLQNQNGFPTKLGEYLMSGNPVVVTSVGEIPLYIQDGYNGYVAQPNNVDSFVHKLCQAVEGLSNGSEVAIRGKQMAKTEFSYRYQTKKALDFILK